MLWKRVGFGLLSSYQTEDKSGTVEDIRFDLTSFWVQLCGLRIRRMKRENVEAIVRTLGKVE